MSIKKVFAAAAFISLALTGAACADYGVNPFSGAVEDGYLNLRNGPGQFHGIIAGIPAGAHIRANQS